MGEKEKRAIFKSMILQQMERGPISGDIKSSSGEGEILFTATRQISQLAEKCAEAVSNYRIFVEQDGIITEKDLSMLHYELGQLFYYLKGLMQVTGWSWDEILTMYDS